ncbi:hypothetical protein AU190_22250 [Mycolicibacterium acapulense]|nr:hypothetical protein AU190_22250 [Mycolicibacterium acapulense]
MPCGAHTTIEQRQHHRIALALERVRQTVADHRAPAADDVTRALGSCGCDHCRAQAVPLVVELHTLGVLP